MFLNSAGAASCLRSIWRRGTASVLELHKSQAHTTLCSKGPLDALSPSPRSRMLRWGSGNGFKFQMPGIDWNVKLFLFGPSQVCETVRIEPRCSGNQGHPAEDIFDILGSRGGGSISKAKVPVRSLQRIEHDGTYLRYHTASSHLGLGLDAAIKSVWYCFLFQT